MVCGSLPKTLNTCGPCPSIKIPNFVLGFAISRRSYLVKASVRDPPGTALWPARGGRRTWLRNLDIDEDKPEHAKEVTNKTESLTLLCESFHCGSICVGGARSLAMLHCTSNGKVEDNSGSD